ncbi:MAG: HAD family hydrolase [Paracoccaceae bacterium]
MQLIVWDFDGVLNANIRDGRFVWADRLQDDLGVDPGAFSDFVFRSGRIRDVVRGRLDLRDVVAGWLSDQGHDITADAFLDYWFANDAIPDEQVTGWMMKAAGRRVIGTNNEARRAAYIEGPMGYGARVERVFASGRMGVAKPDAGFFEAIEQWSGAAPRDILLIDDSLPNIEACIERGWQGFHFSVATRNALPQRLGLT